MLFYYTATGNSLYAARALDAAPLSIPQELRKPEHARIYRDETIGIVCPVFCHLLPPLVQQFISTSRFDAAYFYLVLTYGNRLAGAPERARDFCAQHGVDVALVATVLTVDSFLPGYDVADQIKLEKPTEEHLARARCDIAAHSRRIDTASAEEHAYHARSLERLRAFEPLLHGGLFTITDACTGCGVCVNVCPRGDYDLIEGRAVHTGGPCDFCLACVHNCPEQALGLTVPEANPDARYRNPQVSLRDLMQANSQFL